MQGRVRETNAALKVGGKDERSGFCGLLKNMKLRPQRDERVGANFEDRNGSLVEEHPRAHQPQVGSACKEVGRRFSAEL